VLKKKKGWPGSLGLNGTYPEVRVFLPCKEEIFGQSFQKGSKGVQKSSQPAKNGPKRVQNGGKTGAMGGMGSWDAPY